MSNIKVISTSVSHCTLCNNPDCEETVYKLSSGKDIVVYDCDVASEKRLNQLLAKIHQGEKSMSTKPKKPAQINIWGQEITEEQSDAISTIKEDLRKIDQGITSANKKIQKLESRKKNLLYVLEKTQVIENK